LTYWDRLVDQYIIDLGEYLSDVQAAQPNVIVLGPCLDGLGQHRRSNVDRWHNYFPRDREDAWEEVESKFHYRTRIKLGIIHAGKVLPNDDFSFVTAVGRKNSPEDVEEMGTSPEIVSAAV